MSAPSQSADTLSIPKSAIRRAGVIIGALLALAVLALVIVSAVRALSPNDPLASAINSKEFQAVFLTNGQVYFGKLSAPGGDFYYLRQVYYLASQASPQNSRAQRPTLVKLGSELHAPEDLMVISRPQILYVENLKSSGKVSQAILHYPGP